MRSRVIQGETSPDAHRGSARPVPVVELAGRQGRQEPSSSGAARLPTVLAVLARAPFTLSTGALVLALGLVTGALWRPLVERPLLDVVAHGLPALREGRWWSPLTGLFFAQTPAQYVPTLGGFLLLCGFAELRLGTRRVVPAALGTQLAGVLGAAALLAAASGHGWAWADVTAQARDVGFSAGALGAAAAASATLSAPWRGRLRAALVGYGVVSLVYVGVLWDLEHLLAIALGLAWGPRLAGGRSFANPSRRRARRTAGSVVAVPGEDEQARAARLLTDQGSTNRLAWMTTWRENRWYLPGGEQGEGAGYVAYRVHAGVAVGLCDPVAATAEQRARLLQGFATDVESAGLVPCLFSVTSEAARSASALGWQALQVAEEAVVDLGTLTFRGEAWQDVGTALNRAAAQGITHRLVALAEQPRGIQVQVRAMSEQWTGDKGLPELGFTLGGVDEALDPRVRVGLAVDGDGTVHGVTSWMPVIALGGGPPVGWTLDVARRSPDGFRSTMEFLIASACMAFRDEGASVVSLSGVPLARAGAGDCEVERGLLDAFLDRLGVTLEPYYGFRSLQAFTSTFQPRHEPLYLVLPDETALPRIGVALGRAYLPAAGLRDMVALARARPSRGTP